MIKFILAVVVLAVVYCAGVRVGEHRIEFQSPVATF
jgi:hypothetical protein